MIINVMGMRIIFMNYVVSYVVSYVVNIMYNDNNLLVTRILII